MDLEPIESSTAGFPELTELGKRLEMLRIGRGLSKQHLARHAGTSRQQLWRVMTGKSELTSALKLRLAEVLHVDADELARGGASMFSPTSIAGATPLTHGATTRVASRHIAPRPRSAPRSLRAYLDNPHAIASTLATMPAGRDGQGLKRRLLDVLEDVALATGRPLGPDFFELRRRVLAGEL